MIGFFQRVINIKALDKRNWHVKRKVALKNVNILMFTRVNNTGQLRRSLPVYNNLDCNVSMIPAFVRAIRIPKFASGQSMVRSLNLEDVSEFERYVVMSQAKAFTDFHVDFGGKSSLPRRTSGSMRDQETMRGLERWMESKKEKKVTMTAGNTFFMPGGWIQAVYTHEDFIAVSGNFFHAGCISRQLRAFSAELNVEANSDHRVPEFIPIHFAYMTQKLLKDVEDSNKKRSNMAKQPHLKSTWEKFRKKPSRRTMTLLVFIVLKR
ncbi:unnamed protein product [Caenorhabditis brenneri]